MDPLGPLVGRLHRLGELELSDLAGLPAVLADLARELAVAVPSLHGLSVALLERGCLVTATALAPSTSAGSPRTTLSVPIPALGARVNGHLTLYAETPGALVDLAADLAYALRLPGPHKPPTDPAGTRREPRVTLDEDLPAQPLVPGVTGLVELTRVNQALGVLIGRGCHPDEAEDRLRTAAAAAGLGPSEYAGIVLAEARRNWRGEARDG